MGVFHTLDTEKAYNELNEYSMAFTITEVPHTDHLLTHFVFICPEIGIIMIV